MGVHCERSPDMLFFLTLFSSALAAPQYLPYPYAGYNPGYYHPYAAYPAYQYQPASLLYYPTQQRVGTNDVLTKSLIKFGNFLEINGEFMADTTTTPARTITGTINIQQNGLLDAVTGQNAKFNLHIQNNDLTGKELKVQLGTGTDCTTAAAATGTDAPVDLATVTAPPSLNGFYINGPTTGYNIDGMNSKTSLMGTNKWLMIADTTGVIGCSKAALQ